jgi:hypothetical protein
MNKYTCRVSLWILGPFLTAAVGPHSYGVDTSFHKDYLDRLCVPGSHIKGKLRMSLEEILNFMEPAPAFSLDHLFGQESSENSYEPRRGGLKFTDFVIQQDAKVEEDKTSVHPKVRTRTSIDATSGTAAEHMLRSFEDNFPSDTKISFQGEVSFLAGSETEAAKIAGVIRLGFIWLTSLGSEKGVGFGRLQSVWVGHPQGPDKPVTGFKAADTLQARIAPLEPIAVGGVHKRRTNYSRSEKILTGAAIKGALAAHMNQAFGIEPVFQELSKEKAGLYAGFEKMVEHFSEIRLTHAFPALQGAARPVRIPLSYVSTDGKESDIALSSQPYPLQGDLAPAYLIDWKEPREYFEAADPKEIFTTHTEIDDLTRRSKEGKLFTESQLCPIDDQGRPVEWICNVDFAGIEDPDEQKQTADEFSTAMLQYFDGMGIENRRVKVFISPGPAPSAIWSKDLITDDLALVALQSDALILDPDCVRELQPGEDLGSLYAGFWKEISGKDGSDPCLEMVDFFAAQCFKGGYLYHRYLGSIERQQKPNHYRPYYLTTAGSLFKLKVLNQEKARRCLETWIHRGLEFPAWAVNEYGQYGGLIWKTCPFVRENGYGEIAVNLAVHWEKKMIEEGSQK